MKKILNNQQHWNNRYNEQGDSGYGTYDQMKLKLSVINRSVHGIRSIVDFGCGDFSFGLKVWELFPNSSYVGIDQSDVIIKRNKKIYRDNFEFIVDNKLTRFGELIICMDVLFHINSGKKYNEIIKALREAPYAYLAMSSFDRDGENKPQMAIRKLDEAGFGTLVEKILLEPNGAYLYIWKKYQPA